MTAAAGARAAPSTGLPDDRWTRWDTALWLAPIVAFAVFSDRLELGRDVVIAALFALSLDIVLGYTGVVSLQSNRPWFEFTPFKS